MKREMTKNGSITEIMEEIKKYIQRIIRENYWLD